MKPEGGCGRRRKRRGGKVPGGGGTRYLIFTTAWGEGGVVWTNRGLCDFILPGMPRPDLIAEIKHRHPLARPGKNSEIADVISGLKNYFAGHPGKLPGRLDLSWASPFQKQVYAVLQTIQPGETRSYAEVAKAIGRPAAARAVGQANACNRLPLFIPCHRVVAADGSLGGFSAAAGVKMKARLLKLEKICNRSPSPPSQLMNEAEKGAV